MKKKIITLLLITTMVFGTLSGCGKQENSGGGTDAAAEKQTNVSDEAAEEQQGEGEESYKIGDGNLSLTIYCGFQNAARAHYKDLGDNPVVQKVMIL